MLPQIWSILVGWGWGSILVGGWCVVVHVHTLSVLNSTCDMHRQGHWQLCPGMDKVIWKAWAFLFIQCTADLILGSPLLLGPGQVTCFTFPPLVDLFIYMSRHDLFSFSIQEDSNQSQFSLMCYFLFLVQLKLGWKHVECPRCVGRTGQQQ